MIMGGLLSIIWLAVHGKNLNIGNLVIFNNSDYRGFWGGTQGGGKGFVDLLERD